MPTWTLSFSACLVNLLPPLSNRLLPRYRKTRERHNQRRDHLAHLKRPAISQKVNPDASAEAVQNGPEWEETSHPHPMARRTPPFPSLVPQAGVCMNSLQIREQMDPRLFSSLLLLVVTTLTVLDITGSCVVDWGQCLALKHSFCVLIH